MFKTMRCMGILGLTAALSGCITSGEIKSDTMSFDDVIEDTTNKLLLLNVLRARDKAPLHFADIPVIRESMQESLTLGGTRVYGPVPGTTLRNSTFLNGFVSKSPSFEVNHLDSKDFVTGISSPIDVKFVKYWLDRGLDRRIVLLLFFSAVEIVETRSESGPVNTIRVGNSPRDAVDILRARTHPFSGPEALKCDSQSDFERYLKLINVLKTFFAHSYRERRVLATGEVASQVIALGIIGELGDATDLPKLREIAAKSEPVASRGRGFGFMPVIDLGRVAKNAIDRITTEPRP